jgi:hypothetical protein
MVKVIGIGVYRIVQVRILAGGAYGESKSPGGGGGVVKSWIRRRHCEDRASLLVGMEVCRVKEDGKECRTASRPAYGSKDVVGN